MHKFSPYPRNALCDSIINSVNECLEFYKDSGDDLPYLGVFQRRYEAAIEHYLAGSDEKRVIAVSSGTAACFVAFQIAKQINARKVIAISPIADSGLVNALRLLQYDIHILDSSPGTYDVSPESVQRSISEFKKELSAVFLVHPGGYVNQHTPTIRDLCSANGTMLIEDISQSPGGTLLSGERAGTLGDLCVCSTMYRKNLITGSQGGFLLCKQQAHATLGRSFADRGKDMQGPLLSRTPGQNKLMGLNWNTDELACSIGIESLKKLDETNKRRQAAANYIINFLKTRGLAFNPNFFQPGDAPFFLMIRARTSNIKKQLVSSLNDLNIPHNPDYDFLPEKWHWLNDRTIDLPPKNTERNALVTNRLSVNIFLNEKYPTE